MKSSIDGNNAFGCELHSSNLLSEGETKTICRICHEAADESLEPLISPCDCQGSMKHVHASCMDRWRMLNIDVPNLRDKCQLCLGHFRLKSSAFSKRTILGIVVSNRYAYEIVLKIVSALLLVPSSVLALTLSNFLRRERSNAAAQMRKDTKNWKRDVFGYVLRESLIGQINRLIEGEKFDSVSLKALVLFGLTKLGSYGCTMWLFTDGMADIIPVYYVNGAGERRPSPFLAMLKAVIEFYVIPFCLRTPETIIRLPFYLLTVLMGLTYVMNHIERRLRIAAVMILPYFRYLELGTLAAE